MLQQNLLTPRPSWVPVAFRALARHRFLTAAQIAAGVKIVAPEVRQTIESLLAERLVTKLHPTATLEGPAPEPAYVLTRNGAKMLAIESGEPVPLVPHPRRSLFTLAHELAVTEVGIVLELLHRSGAIALRRWETSREKIATSVLLRSKRGMDRVPLVADGFAVIEHGGKLHGFLVECDRGTVSVARMAKKFAGYLQWSREGGGPEKRFGIRSLRVLVIVPNDGRLARLRDAAIEVTRGTGLLLFAVQSDVTVSAPDRFLANVWRPTRADAEPASLFDGAPMPGAIENAGRGVAPAA